MTDQPRVFDATQTPPPFGAGETPQPFGGGEHPPSGTWSKGDAPSSTALDDLREASAEIVESPPYQFVNPKGRIRLTCRTRIAFREFRRWQTSALPPAERKKSTPALASMDNLHLMSRAITDTVEMVEVLRKGTTDDWRVVSDREGSPLTFADTDLLLVLGAPDPRAALTNAMNGSDAAILRHGGELLDRAGYGGDNSDNDWDSEDPT